MEKAIKRVPKFVRNQFLTADMLNSLVRFTEDQSREIKSDFVGSGVIRGMEVSTDKEKGEIVVIISKGKGLTGNGQSITIENDEKYSRYKKIDAFEKEKIVAELGLSKKALQSDIWELTKDKDGTPLSNLNSVGSEAEKKESNSSLDTLDGKILFLLLDEQIEQNKKPIYSLYETGASKQIIARKIIVDDKLLKEKNSPSGQTAVNGARDLTPISIPRFGWKNGAMQLDAIHTFEDFQFHYSGLIKRLARVLIQRLSVMHELLGKAIGDNTDHPFTRFSKAVEKELLANKHPHFQYIYAYLEDVADTYQELAALDIDTSSEPAKTNASRTGNFLVLGYLVNKDRPDAGRQFFHPSHIAQQDGQHAKANFLYDRLLYLTDVDEAGNLKCFRPTVFISSDESKSPAAAQRVLITPGAGKKSRLPFYYKQGDEKLLKHWNYQAFSFGKAETVKGYNEQPLSIKSNDRSFYRIEGHVGLPLVDVMNVLAIKRTSYNLPFWITAVQLDDMENDKESFWDKLSHLINKKEKNPNADFSSFAQRYAGIEYGSGVPTGGTFVVVATDGQNLTGFSDFVEKERLIDQEYVVGDFFLPYQVEVADMWIKPIFSKLAQPVIHLSRLHFYANDDEKYLINVFPKGGQFSENIPGIIAKGGHFYFQPSLMRSQFTTDDKEDKIVTLEYSVKGKTTSVQITVRPTNTLLEEAPIDRELILEPNAAGRQKLKGVKVHFIMHTNSPKESYLLFNDGKKIDENELERNENIPNQFAFIFLVENGTEQTIGYKSNPYYVKGEGSSLIYEKRITLVDELEDSDFKLEFIETGEPLFFTDASKEASQALAVNPVGGTFDLVPILSSWIEEENIIEMPAAKTSDISYRLKMGGMPPNKYKLIYKVGELKKELPFEIKKQPDIRFDIKQPFALPAKQSENSFYLKVSNIEPADVHLNWSIDQKLLKIIEHYPAPDTIKNNFNFSFKENKNFSLRIIWDKKLVGQKITLKVENPESKKVAYGAFYYPVINDKGIYFKVDVKPMENEDGIFKLALVDLIVPEKEWVELCIKILNGGSVFHERLPTAELEGEKVEKILKLDKTLSSKKIEVRMFSKNKDGTVINAFSQFFDYPTI